MVLCGDGWHCDQLHAHAAGCVHGFEVDAALGVVQDNLAKNLGSTLLLTKVALDQLRTHHSGEVVILDDQAAKTLGSGVPEDIQSIHTPFGDGGTRVDMRSQSP